MSLRSLFGCHTFDTLGPTDNHGNTEVWIFEILHVKNQCEVSYPMKLKYIFLQSVKKSAICHYFSSLQTHRKPLNVGCAFSFPPLVRRCQTWSVSVQPVIHPPTPWSVVHARAHTHTAIRHFHRFNTLIMCKSLGGTAGGQDYKKKNVKSLIRCHTHSIFVCDWWK